MMRFDTGRLRGTTLIETVSALLILGIAAAVAVSSMTSSLPELPATRQPVLARELARDLMDEVLSKPFDPGTNPAGQTRATFSDVDDYNGFTDGPPTFPNGTPIPGATGFTRSVAVYPVATSGPGGSPVGRSSAKLLRVEVTVAWNGKSVKLTGLKAQSQPGILPPSRAAIQYVDGTRQDGQGSSAGVLTFVVQDHIRDVTISGVKLAWSPDLDNAVFSRVTVETVPGTPGGGVVLARWSGAASAGTLLNFTAPFTIHNNQQLTVIVETDTGGCGGGGCKHHGCGSNGSLAAYTLVADWVSGTSTYETVVPSSCLPGAIDVTFTGPIPTIAASFRLTGQGDIVGEDGHTSGDPSSAAVAFDSRLDFGEGQSTLSVVTTGQGRIEGDGTLLGVSGIEETSMDFTSLYTRLGEVEAGVAANHTYASLSLTGQSSLAGPGPYLVNGPVNLTGQGSIGSPSTPAVLIIRPTAALTDEALSLTGQGNVYGVVYLDLSRVPGSPVALSHDLVRLTGQGSIQGLVVVNGPAAPLKFTSCSVIGGLTGQGEIQGGVIFRLNGGVSGTFPIATLTGQGSIEADCGNVSMGYAALGLQP